MHVMCMNTIQLQKFKIKINKLKNPDQLVFISIGEE